MWQHEQREASLEAVSTQMAAERVKGTCSVCLLSLTEIISLFLFLFCLVFLNLFFSLSSFQCLNWSCILKICPVQKFSLLYEVKLDGLFICLFPRLEQEKWKLLPAFLKVKGHTDPHTYLL